MISDPLTAELIHEHSPVPDEVVGEGVFRVVIRSSFARLHKQSHIWQVGLSLNSDVKWFHQLHLHWIGAGLHLTGKVAVSVYLKRVAEAAEAGLGENVFRLFEGVVTGDADGFGKLARESDLHGLSSDDNLVGQLEGVDLVVENDKVAFILRWRQKQRCKTQRSHIAADFTVTTSEISFR